MQTVEEPLETIHLYVVKEEEKKPPVFLPLFAALLCLTVIVGVTIYSAYNPSYLHETLTIPAHFLPIKTFAATQPIIPTGIKSYSATTAHGELTIYNGSILTERIPQGMIVTSDSGVEIVIENTVVIPAGNPPNYGIAMVAAYAQIPGKQGNIQPNTLNQVLGSSLYIRNPHPFTGGKDAFTVTYATQQDRLTALDSARAILATQQAQIKALVAFPCKETTQGKNSVLELSWACQFVSYPTLPGMRITAVRLVGKNLLVDVVFVARSITVWMR